MSTPFRIVALHGFLGCPDDWMPIRLRMPGTWWSPLNVWDLIQRDEVRDWTTLGSEMEAALESAMATVPRLPAVVLAYSFGARLMLAAPGAASRVLGTCLVSCNPGFGATDADARAARRVSDEQWARRLLDWEAPAFFEAWNRQPVLAPSVPMTGRETFPAEPVVLAKAMRVFSVAKQPDWDARLRGWPGQALIVAGERDGKYAAIARRFERASPHLHVQIVPGAGHRVPWDAPDEFVEVFGQWARDLISRSGI